MRKGQFKEKISFFFENISNFTLNFYVVSILKVLPSVAQWRSVSTSPLTKSQDWEGAAAEVCGGHDHAVQGV